MKTSISNVFGIFYLVGAIVIAVFTIAPAFRHEGYSAFKLTCRSNMKQIATAALAYSADFDDKLPPVFTFDIPAGSSQKDVALHFEGLVDRYLKVPEPKALWLCSKESDTKIDPSQEGVPGVMSYVHCLSLRGIIPDYATGGRVIDLSAKADRANIAYMREPIRGMADHEDAAEVVHKNVLASAHGSGTTIAYLDGHVRYKTLIDINADL